MDPITVTTALSLTKSAGDISKKLYEIAKNLKDRDIKQQVDQISDQLRELKQAASELEDENRDLREKLRFQSDEYEFRNPFWYHRSHPEMPLCPKCFASNISAPMSDLENRGTSSESRICLVCRIPTRVHPFQFQPSGR